MTGTEMVPNGMFSSLTALESAGVMTKTSIVLPPGVTYDQYEAMFGMLGEAKESICWWIGDLLNYGEKVYGETYAQASTWTGLHPATLTKYASICSNIPRSRRRPPKVLSFSTHAEVAYLPPKEQDHWLQLAEKNGWNRGKLREALSEARDTGEIERKRPKRDDVKDEDVEILPPAGEDHICQCPACGRYHRKDLDVMK